MTLLELFKSISDVSLSKDQIEDYHTKLTSLYAQMQLELADLEKSEAIFFLEHYEKSDIATRRKWNVTEQGQREITLKRYVKATEKALSSLKNRLYSRYD